MMKLTFDLKTCELLDTVLKAFGDGVHLDSSVVLEVFSGSEIEAIKHINILSELGYVRKIAEIEGGRLGMLFYKEQTTDLFLAQGGFVAQYQKDAEEKKVSDNRNNMADENARLGNEELKYKANIRNQESRIRALDEKLKRFEMLKNYEWLIRLVLIALTAFITWSLKKTA